MSEEATKFQTKEPGTKFLNIFDVVKQNESQKVTKMEVRVSLPHG